MTEIKAFFEKRTYTLTYVVYDPQSKDAIVIDPVLDYDPVAVRVSTESIDEVVAFLNANGLTLKAALDTHAHADHLSGQAEFAKRYPGIATVMGESIGAVLDAFNPVWGTNASTDNWTLLMDDGEVHRFGTIEVKAIHTPGHTPACTSYHIGSALFAGDTMFMPDFGTGRCDFPGGSASDLYDTIMNKLYTLPDETRVFVGHDYSPGGRELKWETTIGASKKENIQLRSDTSRDEFVKWRSDRDATLSLPSLIFQSLQVNIFGGQLPEKDAATGQRYLRLPLNLFDQVEEAKQSA